MVDYIDIDPNETSENWFKKHPDAKYRKPLSDLNDTKNSAPKTEEEQIAVRGHPYDWIYCDNCSNPSHSCHCSNPDFSAWEYDYGNNDKPKAIRDVNID